jgi:hypothetical protein
MVVVNINWFWIDQFSADMTASEIRDAANTARGDARPLQRFPQSVYVIRTKPPFAIQYPNEKHFSPTLYIGEGNLVSRLSAHRKWLTELQEQGQKFTFEVAFCMPRLAGNKEAYKDYEAFLLSNFKQKFGSLPLHNKQNESTRFKHGYQQSEKVIGPTSGVRYTWAIQPLRSNKFRDVFKRTGVRV